MMIKFKTITLLTSLLSLFLSACQAQQTPSSSGVKVLAVESFITDIAQNVAGDRLFIDTLMPLGIDPHAFEPTPRDVVKIAECDLLIINGAGFESWLQPVLDSVGEGHTVVEASAGLQSRTARQGEAVEEHAEEHLHGDPHFWLNPLNTIHYVETIRDALISVDPDGKDAYTQNAADYIKQLQTLDQYIQDQVAAIAVEDRVIVTNHESFGYFADRYNFQIVGTVIPSISTDAAPSAQQLAHLIDQIKATGASAIFIETGANPQIAEQVAQETGVKVITDLYTHSITDANGGAPTYIDMLKYNTQIIVDALK